MSNIFGSLCDDFSLDICVNTQLDIPSERDLVLGFFERVRKEFPDMGNFYKRDTGESCLESERRGGSFRWVVLEKDRVFSGFTNPENIDLAVSQHHQVLNLLPYMLGIGGLDVECLDVTFSMDFDFDGNQDEVICEAFFGGSPFGKIMDMPNSKPIGVSPNFFFSLTEDCRTQARIGIESRTTAYQVRSGSYGNMDPITLSFAVRQYPRPYEKFDLLGSFQQQYRRAEELLADKIIPNFVMPLNQAIAHRR